MAKRIWLDEMKENVMGEPCGTKGGVENCTLGLSRFGLTGRQFEIPEEIKMIMLEPAISMFTQNVVMQMVL
jgi:hypothetical protein